MLRDKVIDWLKFPIRRVKRIKLLASVMPFFDAFKFALSENKPANIDVYLSSIRRRITVRGATSDIRCFEKVFIDGEYHSPFEMSPKVIVDAGANIGMATLYFASRNPEANILAVEPESTNFKMLQRNCEGLRNVVLVQAALWPVSKRLQISNSANEAWAFSVSDKRTDGGLGEVSAITMEDIFGRLEGRDIDLLKLDIEGSERELFLDADWWLDRIDCIVIELHDRFRPGCAKAFYSLVAKRNFIQEIRGENIFVRMC